MSRVSGIILAAGLSSRMKGSNKLTTNWHGKPLVYHVAKAALGSQLEKVVAVTGHHAEAVEAALPDGCLIAWNGDYAEGMAGSIRCGQYRMQGYGPVLILLGDMPLVTSAHIDSMIAAFEDGTDDTIIVATANGVFGNPVLFGGSHFVALKLLEGDSGARSIVDANRSTVVEVEIGAAARRDFDTSDAFDQAAGPKIS